MAVTVEICANAEVRMRSPWKFLLAQCWRAAAPRVTIARYSMNRAHLLLIAALCVLAPGQAQAQAQAWPRGRDGVALRNNRISAPQASCPRLSRASTTCRGEGVDGRDEPGRARP